MEIKRGRGRPRKNTTTNVEEENLIHESQSEEEIEGWEEEIESSEEEVEDSEEEREMTNDHLAKVIDDFIDEDMDGNQAPDSILGLPKTVTGEPKKSRGRPRKNKVTENGEAGVSRNVEGYSDEEDGSAKTNGDNGSASKKRRGRPPKSADKKTPSFTSLVSNNGHASEKRRPGRPRKSDGRSLSIGNMEELDGVVPNTPVDESAKKSRKGRPRKRPLENGSASGHVGASSVGHSEGRLGFVSKDPKKAKILDVTPLRKSTRYMSPPRVDGHRQTAAEAAAEDVKDSPSMNAVVKVFCVHTEPNFSLPWQRKRQFSSNSSGFVIEGRRVLTNAHSVEHHTQVKLKKRGSDTKYLAKVLAIGTECDIAMLSVDDDEFWEGVSPVQFGELPTLQDAVTVVGYPIGGDTISVTSGVVSRIEVLSYVHGSTELIGVQIDAAINAGNSGGPAFSDKGQCVGIAFQSLKHEDAENIGYVIPTPVIRHFITDYERNGEYTGFPMLGIEWQKMENPDLRVAMGMNSNQKGVRIRRVEPTAPASEYLKSSDILLSFDGIDIANDGTVPFRRGERIGFTYLVSQKYTGENANVRILRESVIHEFDIQLSTQKRLVPAHIKGKPPSYYIVAGFVFSSVSVPYLRSEYGKDYDFDAPVKLLDKLLHSLSETEDEQLVVISQVLVADINIGYEDIVNTQVLSVNGVRVRNLKHLAEMVEKCEQEFLKFDLEYHQIVVLATQKAKEATLDILKTHCIPSAMSEDLKM